MKINQLIQIVLVPLFIAIIAIGTLSINIETLTKRNIINAFISSIGLIVLILIIHYSPRPEGG